MKRALPGAVLAAGLIFSNTASSAPSYDSPSPESMRITKLIQQAQGPVTPTDVSEMRADFDQLRGFWSRMYPGLKAVQFSFLPEDETVGCQSNGHSIVLKGSKDTTLGYCSSSKRVIIGEAGFRFLRFIGEDSQVPLGSAVKLVIAHELGHAVQDQQHKLTWETIPEQQSMELQADCYGGTAATAVYPDAAKQAPSFYKYVSVPSGMPLQFDTHGTYDQRFGRFAAGTTDLGLC